MKLKTRLIVSFMIIVLIPVILSVCLYGIMGKYQADIIEETYGIEGASIDSLSNSVAVLSKQTEGIYRELEHIAKTTPNKLEDTEFLGEYNQKLKERETYLILIKDESILYMGQESEKTGNILNQIKKYSNITEESDAENGVYLGSKSQVLVKQIHFERDKSEDILYLVTDVSYIIPESKSFLIDLVFGILIILIVTAGALSYWIYRSVTKPLEKMQNATQNIKEGNLDFVLKTDAKDEMGMLLRDLEGMRKRLQASAEEKIQYDKESKELISNISHDLKTPVTAIKGYAEGIMDGVADTPEKMDKYIHTIYNKANEMNLLINELTLYSKIDTNRIPYNFSTISVNEYFNDCAEDLSFELESKNAEFNYYNYVDSDVIIIADAEQIRRVIHNIINNSLKYMDKSKQKINLRIRDVGDFVQIEIEDNGKGIAAKDLPHIFERFYRTDTSRNSSKGGSGIGLSIVKKIIEEHGGKIWATSKEGTGTTMIFILRKYQEVPFNE